ncbi:MULTISPECIES: helix-turn-helix domain-containing protein [Ureibacillus]|uniref:AraC-like DNA-binding protein n=1 Tax=Ureibacillus thermosphaericus TaxID=51173 RepID=A0A840Q5B7_URETH|nr:AraC family transcriptional regulator [Ureibacillus thermosphaericus]MBB5150166.1 AraC-like DNA-binding protein [Ureibacillus thermosphaericus]NKZ32249.1 AraC family transcriptional regulator [Ureibacillus thermosphaericus]
MLNVNPDQFVIKPSLATINCEPNWQWKRKAPIPNYDLLYVWSGKGTLILNGKDFKLQRGSCFLFKPGDWTTATQDPMHPLVITYIHFDLEIEPNMIPKSYRILQDRIHFESLLSQYVRLFLVKTFAADIEGKLILKQLMIQLLREDQQSETIQIEESTEMQSQLFFTIREVANYVQQHPGKNHTVESLAARANFSPRYFSKKFKEIMGQTIQSYVVETRIKRAEHLLHYTGMTVTEVADALGYNNIHFFSRQFKAYTGKSPSEIRTLPRIRKSTIKEISLKRNA